MPLLINYPADTLRTKTERIFRNKKVVESKSITQTKCLTKTTAIKSALTVPFLTPANHLNKAHRSEQHGPGAPAFVFSLADYDNFNPGKVSP